MSRSFATQAGPIKNWEWFELNFNSLLHYWQIPLMVGWCSINWINLPAGDRVSGLQQQCTLTFLTIVRRSIIDRTQFVDFWKLIRAQSLIEPNLSISWKLLRAQSYRWYQRFVICTAEKIYCSMSQKLKLWTYIFWNIEQSSWTKYKAR